MNNAHRSLSPPKRFQSDEFLLRPISTTDAEADYDALMETTTFLRSWEGTGWPEEGFTVEANREDLARLQRRHEEDESYTYTVIHPTSEQCLGCVYIFPTSAKLFVKARIEGRNNAQWSDFDVAVYFWVRQSRMTDGLDERLLEALDEWLRQEWRINDYLLVTNELVEHQISLLTRINRELCFAISYSNKSSQEWAFSRPSKTGVVCEALA